MKICSKCKIEKDESEFNKNKLLKDGLSSYCKSCNKEIYKQRPKIDRSEYHKKYNEENNEKRKQAKRENYHKKREYYLNQSKEFYKKYPEISKKWRENNRGYSSKYQKEKRKTNPEFKLEYNIRRLFMKNIKLTRNKKRKPLFEYTEISYMDYSEYFKTNYPVEFLEITEKNKYHIDHIIPCAIYDFNNPEDIKKCWQPENLRLILAKENLEKSASLDFYLIEKHNIWHLLPEKILKELKKDTIIKGELHGL